MLKKALKLMHEFGAAGVMGSLGTCIVIAATAPRQPLAAVAATWQTVAAITRFLFLPSLALVLITGLLAIAANEPYKNAAWAWLKALLGISMFEGSLLTVVAGARRASALATLAASGGGEPERLAAVLLMQWGGLWLLLARSAVNVVLAVWRPRLTWRKSRH